MDPILERIYHRSVLKFLAPLSLQETYQVIVDEATKLVKGQYGSILLLQKGELVRVYSSTPGLFDVESGRKGPLGSSDPRYQVVAKKKPMVLTGKQMSALKKKFPALKGYEDRAAIMIPLLNRNRAIGMLSVIALKNDDFDRNKLSNLRLFGALASLAIRKAQMYDEIKLALETRDLFISMASHELRTPLTAINGYAQLLHSRLLGKGTREAQWVESLSAECLRLTLLVKELLEINRIKAGELNYHLKECHLRRIITRAIQEFNFAHTDRQIVFEDRTKKESDSVVADYDKLLQVINNLLENAAKFSSRDKPIIILLKSKGSNLAVCIKDYGKGISKDDLPKIFDSFYRGKGVQQEGMGLGLFIVRDIMTRLKGDIKVSSKKGKWTMLEVSLPKNKFSKLSRPTLVLNHVAKSANTV